MIRPTCRYLCVFIGIYYIHKGQVPRCYVYEFSLPLLMYSWNLTLSFSNVYIYVILCMHNICSVRPTPRLAPRRCSSSATSLIVSLLVTALTDLFIANFSACSPADNYLGNYVTVAVPSPSALCSPQVAAQAC